MESSREIYGEFGPRGFWRGYLISLPLCFHAVIKMSCYEKLKELLAYLNKEDRFELNYLVAGFVSKVTAIVVTYPLVTMRTRIQQKQHLNSSADPKYTGHFDLIQKTIRNEGVRGFYKGLSASVLMNTPAVAIYFYVYEKLKTLIKHTRSGY